MRNKFLRNLTILTFLVKAVFAILTELNNDEVYYWTYAQKLQWNYFDHPPAIALLLKIFTLNLNFPQEFFLRLGPMVCAACSTWLIYLIGKKIKNEAAGIIAALLFTASPYSSLMAGLLVIPDAPQLVFWLGSVYLMLMIIDPIQTKRKQNSLLLLLGVVIGCCILSKVHGVFLWFGFLMYGLFYFRKLFSNPFLYLSGFITLLLISPIFFWNLSNNFISYRYHSNRVSFFSHVQLDSFFRELFGEVIYNNPISYVLLVTAIIAIIKKRAFVSAAAQRLLLLVAIPLIVVVVFISIFSDTLPHWTGPAYTTLIPLLAAFLATKQEKIQQQLVPVSVKWALAFTLVLLIPVLILIKAMPVNIGNKESSQLGSGDPTLDMNGFKNFGLQFDSLYRKDVGDGRMQKNAFIMADYWFPAAHLDYYVARPDHLHFIAVGELPAIHHYAWLNRERPFLQSGDNAYFIAISNYYKPPTNQLSEKFEKILPADTITQFRSGAAVRNFIIYRLIHYKGGLPADGVISNN